MSTVQIKFGGWHDGDNHKPYRGWYFVCACGHVGKGQLLPESARRQWKKHSRNCPAASVTEGHE